MNFGCSSPRVDIGFVLANLAELSETNPRAPTPLSNVICFFLTSSYRQSQGY